MRLSQPERMMSREVHNGPTDETQARGEPYSGDPEGGAGLVEAQLQKLPLDEWHRAQGGRMVPFAGYEMPVQYEGIMAEHLWVRENAGLFDVSHMGQILVHGSHVDSALETLLPGELKLLGDMKLRYSLLLAEDGTIIDDLMATRRGEAFYLVVNGATKQGDLEVFEQLLPRSAVVDHMKEQALLALQGPKAAEVLEAVAPGVSNLSFMEGGPFRAVGHPVWISRSGYTGEDGFEISIPSVAVQQLADWLVGDERVKPIGLGARDSLRLEAGLPLYGHDLNETISPIEADLGFAVSKRRREAADFPGARRILAERDGGLSRIRVGLIVEGAPAREGAEILDQSGAPLGVVTSGGFAPSLGKAIALGFVPPTQAAPGTKLQVSVRNRAQAAEVVQMPFVPHRYFRKPKAS